MCKSIILLLLALFSQFAFPSSSLEVDIEKYSSLEDLSGESWLVTGGGGLGWVDDIHSDPSLANSGVNDQSTVRLTIAPGGLHKRINSTPVSPVFCEGTFGIWLKTSDYSNLYFAIFLWREDGGYYQFFIDLDRDNTVRGTVTGDWLFLKFNGYHFAASGGAPAWGQGQTIKRFDFGIYPKMSPAQKQYEALVSDFYIKLKSKPTVIISFDDSNDTDYTIAAPYLASLGMNATTYTIREDVGKPGKLNETQLDILQSEYDWSIASHGSYDLRLLDNASRLEDLSNQKSWMSDRGYSWRHYAYPLGGVNEDVISDMKSLGFFSGRIVNDSPMSPAVDPQAYTIGGWGTSLKSLQDLKDSLDRTIQYGLTLNVYTHGLYLGDATHTDETLWKSMMDEIYNAKTAGLIQVLNIDQYYDQLDLDSDQDGLEDSFEININTDPHNWDSDGDNISDYDEVAFDGDDDGYDPQTDTNPLDQDTDGDGYSDGAEVTAGSDPLSSNSIPDAEIPLPLWSLFLLAAILAQIGFNKSSSSKV